MSDRLEKLYTLTDVENLPDAPVTIEAGGLIKDNQTGRVIARMYLKNCSDKPLTSVLVGFRPKGENGKTISGMRDYLYDASGVPVGEIFGDQTGILFDNNETKSFSADVEGVDFEDGEFWDAAEAKKKEEELKLIVPEEKEQTAEAPETWGKPIEKEKGPEVWESESHDDETHSSEIYGAAIVEKTFEEPEEEPFEPASLQSWQLGHAERPALEEETDAYKQDQEKAVIELDGPSDEEQPVIELDGPVQEEAEPEPEQPEAEPAVTPAVVIVPEAAPAEEPQLEVEEPQPEPEAPIVEEPVANEQEEPEIEEPQPKPEPEPAAPSGPVRLADMYGGIRAGSDLALYADSYGMPKEAEEPVAEPVAEPVIEPAPEPVAEPVIEPAQPVEEIQPEVEVPAEEEPARPSVKMDIENPWAGYSSDYAPPLGAVKEPDTEPAAPAEEIQPEPAAEPAIETVMPAAEPEAPAVEEPVIEEPQPVEAPVEEPVNADSQADEIAETITSIDEGAEQEPEHIPSIEDTIELPKAVAPEKSGETAEAILAAAVSKEEPAEKAEEAAVDTEVPAEEPVNEEVKATHEKADVVFAEETEAIPSLIEDKEKAITGEDHSGRNLINIIVFGGIALVILLVLLIKM